MKKLAIALSAALIVALAVPAFAASTLQLGGQLGTDFTYGKASDGKYGMTGKSWLDVNLAAEAQGGTQIKGVIKLTPWEIKSGLEQDADGNYIRTPFENLTPIDGTMPFGVSSAYLQAVGPFWTGGPSMTTTAGDITMNKDNYVAWLGDHSDRGDRKGLAVEGFKVGPLSADAFYVWPGAETKKVVGQPDVVINHGKALGLSTVADIQGIHVGAAMVRPDGSSSVDFATNASAQVIPGLTVNGVFAADRKFFDNQKDNYAYRVGGSFSPLSWLSLDAGYRATMPGFAPEYVATSTDNAPKAGTGYNVGAKATVQGVNLAASFDQPTDNATASADTTVAGVKLAGDVAVAADIAAQKYSFSEAHMSAERSFALAGLPAISGKYAADIKPNDSGKIGILHDLSASTTLNVIPQLQNVTLTGDVKVQDTKLSDASIGATYVAPNGINLGASYGMVNGASVTAGMQASF